MDNIEMPAVSSKDEYISKNTLIVIILVILLFSFLGINLLNKTGNFLESVKNLFSPIISQIVSIFAYTFGSLIDTTADAVAVTSKTGIDITHDTIQDVGELMKKAGSKNVNPNVKKQLDNIDLLGIQTKQNNKKKKKKDLTNENFENQEFTLVNPQQSLDISINQSKLQNTIPSADNSFSTIQNPITSNKSSWALVGEYQNRHGCIDVHQQNHCLSGQIFPDQKSCINPLVNPPNFLGTISSRGK